MLLQRLPYADVGTESVAASGKDLADLEELVQLE
jgi:hypothetical protein